MTSTLIRIADFLASKARVVMLFLVLCYLVVVMQMVLAGVGWFSLTFIGLIGFLLILLFWFLVRLWVGVVAETVKRDD